MTPPAKRLAARSTSPSSAVTSRRKDRRDGVIDAGARAYAELGYHATTIDDIVEASGLTRGGLYHYINGKEDVLLAIHHRYMGTVLSEIREVVRADLSPDETLRQIARTMTSAMESRNNDAIVMMSEWRMIVRPEEAWASVRNDRDDLQRLVQEVIVRGIDAGMFEVADVDLAVLGFLSMLNYSPQWFRPGGRISGYDLADQFSTIFIRGIST